MSLEIIKELIVRELSTRGIPHFIGGSSRFGYFADNSDLDVVVLNTPGLPEFLNDLDNNWKMVRSGRNYINRLAEVKVLGGKVHFIIFEDGGDFMALSNEHNEVCSFLNKNETLVKFIIELKKLMEINGTAIFNSIKEVMKTLAVETSNVEDKPIVGRRFLRIDKSNLD